MPWERYNIGPESGNRYGGSNFSSHGQVNYSPATEFS